LLLPALAGVPQFGQKLMLLGTGALQFVQTCVVDWAIVFFLS
jgi:hypothetical protein